MFSMQEYVSEAIVLKKQPLGDCDFRYSIFTRRFGKMVAKAKSARKITSKLAGHLEPGSVIRTRLIEKNGLQIIDALKERRLSVALSDLSFLSDILSEGEAEPELWERCAAGDFSRREIFRVLGWNPEYAECATCASPEVFAFHIPSQEFFCRRCASKLGRTGIILIEDVRL
jgi:recombinational DNA repair protein (RecF pathway)